MAMLLFKNGADVDYVDENVMTMLMWATTQGMYDACDELIDRNALDVSGDNCIDHAITYMGDGYMGDLDTLKMLCKYADLSDNDIYTIISYDMQCSNDEYVKGIEYLVSKMSYINKYIDDPNETILCLAVYNGLEKTSKMLMEHGAWVNLYIIYNAENTSNSELMKVLLDNFDIKSINEEECQKLLYKMIEGGNYEIAKYLIDKGVNIGEDSKKYLEYCLIQKMKSLLKI